MKVKCPHCLTIKTIDKTNKNKQVRCSKREGGCGEKFYTLKNIVLEKPIVKTVIKTNETIKIPTIKMNGTVKTLIIALNYAINTIKNKKPVKDKDVNSTWYQYYTEWSRIRRYFQSLEEDK